MVTIRDVARLAGVSPATVSQALNGRGRVDVRTRERVAQAATKLRYVPNLNGRRLARRRAECVAVLQGRNMTTVFNDSFYRVVLGGMAEVTQARGYSLVFTPPADGATDADLNRVLGHGTVDGALVLGAVDGALLLALRHRGLPVVLVDNYLPGVDLPAVIPDYQAGARLATEHLLRLGHRRVAFLGAAVSYPFGWQTLEGYGEALAAGTIAQDPALIRQDRDRRRDRRRRRRGASWPCPSLRRRCSRSPTPWPSARSGPPGSAAFGCRKGWPWSGWTTSR